MAAWPDIGMLLLDGFGEQPESAVLRTDMESGPPKQRRVKSRVMITRPMAVRVTQSEFTQFKTWFRDTVAHGTDWFDWTDPNDGQVKQARIVNGEYQAAPAVRSEGAPLEWTLSFHLETWE